MNTNLSKFSIFCILFVCTLIFTDSAGLLKFNSWQIILSFIINGFFAITLLSSSFSKDGISLRTMFWFFNSVFLFLVPFLQYLTGNWLFLKEFHDLIYANFLILFWMLLFLLGYKSGVKKAKNNLLYKNTKNPIPYLVHKGKLWIAASFSVVIALYFIQSIGLTSLLLRSQAGIVTVLGGWGPLGLIGEYYLRPLSLFLFLFIIYSMRSAQFISVYKYILFVVSLIILIILNFPTATARFYTFAVYLGLLIHFMKPKPQNGHFYLFILLFSLIGSNWINFARYADDFSLTSISFNFNIQDFFVGTFDAYENFVHAINYIELNGITWGNQLLGVLLFWLPRSFWADKPIGTGAFIAQKYLRSYYTVTNDNLSAPLIEEFYVNFGLPAVLIGSGILGRLFGYLDWKYREYQRTVFADKIPPLYTILYPFLIGLTLFVLRGDGMSSFAYSSGFIAAYATLNKFLIKKISRNFLSSY